MSDRDSFFLASFVGEPSTLTLRQYVDTATDTQLADLVNAIAARLAVRGRKAEARALFGIEMPMGDSRRCAPEATPSSSATGPALPSAPPRCVPWRSHAPIVL